MGRLKVARTKEGTKKSAPRSRNIKQGRLAGPVREMKHNNQREKFDRLIG